MASQDSITVTASITDPSANDILLGAVDAYMPQGELTKMQAVALAFLTSNGDGTYSVGSFVGPDAQDSIKVQDAQTGINLSMLQVSELLTLSASTVVVSLTDTTDTPLFIARDPTDGSRIDIVNIIITNRSTAEAELLLTCDTQITPIIVPARATMALVNIIRGGVDVGWSVQLTDAPDADVVITAGARYVAAGF